MTDSNKINKTVAVLLIVDLERTTEEAATAALKARLESPDSDVLGFTFEFATISLREDGLGDNLQKAALDFQSRGIEDSMCVLVGQVDGEDFQKPMTSTEIEETLTNYAMAVQIEELMTSLGQTKP